MKDSWETLHTYADSPDLALTEIAQYDATKLIPYSEIDFLSSELPEVVYTATPDPRIVHTNLAGAPLGEGLISKLAQRAVDLGLNPRCYSFETMAYVVFNPRDEEQGRELDRYAKSIGLPEGPVDVKGTVCPCNL